MTIDPADTNWPLKFPTAISKRGDLIAAMVALKGNSDFFYPVWLRIKRVSTDQTVHLIDLMDVDLPSKLGRDCRDPGSICPHLHELEKSAKAANAVLAKHEWRPFPCYRNIGPTGPARDEAGCDSYRDLEVRFEESRIHVSLRGRVLVDREQPTWSYRGTSCKEYMYTHGGPMAFDPQTGILLIWVTFGASVEGCDVPIWDFHPIRMPVLRTEPGPVADGGAP